MEHPPQIPHMEPPIPEQTFVAPRQRELVLGLVYLVLHMLVIGSVIYRIAFVLGISLDTMGLNLIYLSIAALFLVLAMRHYLIESFACFRAYGLRNFKLFGLGAAIRYGGTIPLAIATVLLLPDFATTPNNEVVLELAHDHFFLTAFLAIVLAPIAEELLFRGVLYGGLRNKSKVLAYLVSTLLFAFLHILSFLFLIPAAPLFLMMSLYIPAGFSLAWVYEKSGSIWTPIFLHALMNLVALALSGLLL